MMCENKLKEIFTDFSHHKISRDQANMALKEEIKNQIVKDFPETDPTLISKTYNQISKSVFRDLILDEDIRYTIM